MADRRAIGVFDSGLGGLTVASEIIRLLPHENIVYFGDTGRVPYGTRSRDTIRRYAVEDERFLLAHDVKIIVAACGTVSSVASDTALELPVPFVGVVSHSVDAAVNATKNKKIGVIGTPATVNSGEHKRQILELMPDAEVISNSCPMFVPLVEEGWYSSDDVVVCETARRYLEPMLQANVDTLILGCTHYPVLSRVISGIMGDGVSLINAGTATAVAVERLLKDTSCLNDTETAGKHSFYVSDKADSFSRIASVLLGENIDEKTVEQVDLTAYDEGCINRN